ncbi:MAG TPA: L,D-transpeptidase, partial [Opitutaceae bacterium]|nr:L,D-transpeptidase [Opitutaceae bacterium]
PPDPTTPVATPPAAEAPPPSPDQPPVKTTLELQVELHRRGFSCGSIDGVMGAQTAAALRAFQRAAGIAETGTLDRATRDRIRLTAPAVAQHVVSVLELGDIHPVPSTWLEKSQLSSLGYGSALEEIAEHYHANPNLVRRLNPTVDWSHVLPGSSITVPAVEHATIEGTAAQIVITLAARELDVVDGMSRIIAHFPVSIARMAEKRPVGELHVIVVIPNPDYTFDPAVFPESAEGRKLGRRLVVPPGPNNPVGLAWIGLDRPGYGIHGTPDPEKIGRTESHGCFRLANWDVLTLLGLVHVGMPVVVEP